MASAVAGASGFGDILVFLRGVAADADGTTPMAPMVLPLTTIVIPPLERRRTEQGERGHAAFADLVLEDFAGRRGGQKNRTLASFHMSFSYEGSVAGKRGIFLGGMA